MRGVLDGASWFTSGSLAELVDLMPQWTMNVHGKCLNQVLEVVEERNMLTDKITWQSTDFLRHAEGENRRTRSHHFHFHILCEHGTLFPVEDFLWWCPPNFENGAVRTAWVVGGVWSVRGTVWLEVTEPFAHFAGW